MNKKLSRKKKKKQAGQNSLPFPEEVYLPPEQPPEQPAVHHKGIGSRLCFFIDPDKSQDQVKSEIRQQLDKMDKLGRKVRLIIDAGDPEKSRQWLNLLSDFLKTEYDIDDIGLPGSVEEVRVPINARKRRRDIDRSWKNYNSQVLMLRGRVRAGQRVETPHHLIIIGDVNPGAEITAGGDILVLGSLCGKAIAGSSGDITAIVFAMDFRPTQLQIAGLVAAGTNDGKAEGAEYAHVADGSILVDDYLKANPFKRIQWPEVR